MPDNRALADISYEYNRDRNNKCKISNLVESLRKDRKFVFLPNVQSKDYKSQSHHENNYGEV